MIPWLLSWIKNPTPPVVAAQVELPPMGFLDITDKVWGAAYCLHRSPGAALYKLVIRKFGYSSIHYHQRKRQIFYVHFGAVYVKEFDESGAILKSSRLLLPGDVYHTPAKVRHQFFASEFSEAVELYLPSRNDLDDNLPWRAALHPHWHVKEDDIVRMSEGGIGVEGAAGIDELA